MAIYVVYWLIGLSILLIYNKVSTNTIKILTNVLLIYSLLITFFRGDVGTDTLLYQEIMLNPYNFPNIGFLFFIINNLLYGVFDDVVIAVRFLSVFFFLPLFYLVNKLNKNQLLIFIVLFIPFMLQFSMNILREGIGIVFFLVSIYFLTNKKQLLGYLFLLIALSFHYILFILLFLVYVFLYFYEKNYIFELKKILLIILIGIFNFIGHSNFVNDKINLYMHFQTPSFYSGISKLTIVLLFLLFVLKNNFDYRFKKIYIIYILFLTVSFFIVAKFSYVGLRLLDLSIFLTIVVFFIYFGKNMEFRINKNNYYILIAIYIIFSLFTANNFIKSAQNYDTKGNINAVPFIPYKTFFEEMK